MGLTVQDADTSELPEGTTDGFKLVDDDGETVMFFHWNRDPEQTDTTKFADVLAALPSRLAELGHGHEESRLIGEIHSRFRSQR